MKDVRKELKVMIDEEQLQERISKLATEISADYSDKPLTIISVLRGSVFFAVDLTKKLDLIFDMEFVELSSYGNGRESSGKIVLTKDIVRKDEDEFSISKKNLLIVEDIIDTGRSLKFLIDHLQKFNPLSIKTCVLLDKIDRRKEDISPDYTGFVIPDRFIVGYGLDYCNHFRNINYVGYLED